MNSDLSLTALLSWLEQTALAQPFSKDSLVAALENLLLWLNEPENNTDYNCKEIDSFISAEIVPDQRFNDIPADLQKILVDMGAVLRDAHSIPRIAGNFDTMPNELLTRVRNL